MKKLSKNGKPIWTLAERLDHEKYKCRIACLIAVCEDIQRWQQEEPIFKKKETAK